MLMREINSFLLGRTNSVIFAVPVGSCRYGVYSSRSIASTLLETCFRFGTDCASKSASAVLLRSSVWFPHDEVGAVYDVS